MDIADIPGCDDVALNEIPQTVLYQRVMFWLRFTNQFYQVPAPTNLLLKSARRIIKSKRFLKNIAKTYVEKVSTYGFTFQLLTVNVKCYG